MNKQEKIIKTSVSKGYYVDDKGILFNKDGKEMKLSEGKNGYLSFSIRVDGSNPTRSFVHKLQAYQKFGDELFKLGVVVRHYNGIPTDNSSDNILIGTVSDNALDVPKESRVNKSKLSRKYDHGSILRDYKEGFNYKQLKNKYNISSSGTISYIINKSLMSENS